jgi:glucoamylase
VTSTSLDFFRQFASSISTGTYSSDSSEYLQLTSAVKSFADGFIEIAAKYTPSNGGLAEQFDKGTGQPLSAADLTWSYASVLTAAASRGGVKASWGASGLIVPSECVPNPGPQVTATFNVNATTVFGGTCMHRHQLDIDK